jgi:DNA (cytosine-5)-methyltransferase 1
LASEPVRADSRASRQKQRVSLTVGSLFSGIGGLDLGLERAGMNVIWQSEIDPYASRVLAKHWPEVPNYGNIKNIRWGDIVRPDVICGGYPCQPFSTAGKRQGTDDPRHLWPWVREAISELRPQYAILENVRGHVSLGLNVVLGEMASIGYDAEWQIVSAASVGAPHRRERVIIVAYPNSSNQTNGGEREVISSQDTGWGNDRSRSRSDTGQVSVGSSGQNTCHVADTYDSGSRTSERRTNSNGSKEIEKRLVFAQSWVGRRRADVAYADGEQLGQRRVEEHSGQTDNRRDNNTRGQTTDDFGQWWAVEPDVGRVAHGVPSRVDRLKGLGNAVVPQVAEFVGRMVMEHARTC